MDELQECCWPYEASRLDYRKSGRLNLVNRSFPCSSPNLDAFDVVGSSGKSVAKVLHV